LHVNDRDPEALFANGLSLLFAFCGSLERLQILTSGTPKREA
jgi:hypothetical protein